MSKTYKLIRLVGTSEKSYEEAIQNAVSDARESLHDLDWFQVVEQRGRIDSSGKVVEFQVILEVGFRIIKK